MEPKQLEQKIKTLRFRWNNATKQYIATYPNAALGIDSNTKQSTISISIIYKKRYKFVTSYIKWITYNDRNLH